MGDPPITISSNHSSAFHGRKIHCLARPLQLTDLPWLEGCGLGDSWICNIERRSCIVELIKYGRKNGFECYVEMSLDKGEIDLSLALVVDVFKWLQQRH